MLKIVNPHGIRQKYKAALIQMLATANENANDEVGGVKPPDLEVDNAKVHPVVYIICYRILRGKNMNRGEMRNMRHLGYTHRADVDFAFEH